MLLRLRQSRVLPAFLLALALMHADPGGMVYCVAADGSRELEFSCACGGHAAHCSCGQCGESSGPSEGASLSAPACNCTDIAIELAPGYGSSQPNRAQLVTMAVAAQPLQCAELMPARPQRNVLPTESPPLRAAHLALVSCSQLLI